MPHKWAEGTAIYPHVHWVQEGSDTVQFGIVYRVYDIGDAIPASWQVLYTYEAELITYTSGTIHQMAMFNPIDMTGVSGSGMVDIKLYRKDDGGTGRVTGDVGVKEFDVHYEINKPGSDTASPD